MNIQSGVETIAKKVLYAKAVYGDEEKQAVMQSLENGWLASGPKVKEFEQEVARRFGKKYGIAVNSGSSANLLALAAASHFHTGKQVITPACTFSTTVSAITLNSLTPIFVDVIQGRYVIDHMQVKDVISDNTLAIFVPQLIGGLADMHFLKRLAKHRHCFLIDDSCDTFAPTLEEKTIASYADITTTSFYGSHIITACGVGGMILTDDQEIVKYVTMLRDWGRYGDDREAFDTRFNHTVDTIPYDGKFVYGAYGYNLKMNEVSAAFGLEQLKKLPDFLKKRSTNFALLDCFFSQYAKWFILPDLIDGGSTNWLAYPLTIRADAPFTRYDLLKHFEQDGIQTRVLFSGNVTRHDAYRKYFQPFEHSDEIMERGFLLGCHHGMGRIDVDYICDSFIDFAKSV